MIDAIDKAILNILQQDGRTSNADIARQISAGETRIAGVMMESNLVAGRQDVVPGKPLVYGQSITDGCIDWEATVRALDALACAVAARRKLARRHFGERSA